MNWKRIIIVVAVALAVVIALLSIGIQSGTVSEERTETESTESTMEVGELQLASAATAPSRKWKGVKWKKVGDPFCRKMRNKRNQPGKCQRLFVVKKKFKGYREVVRRTDSGRVANRAIMACWGMKASMRGLFYYNWKEEIRGEYCQGGGKLNGIVYKCGYGYSYGTSIENLGCWKRRRPANTEAGFMKTVYDQFRVHVLFKGFPIHNTFQFHVNMHPSGHLKAYIDK